MSDTDTSVCNEKLVLAYLREHPDIFSQNPSLITELELAHQCEGATSLLEKQAKLMREEIRHLKRQLAEMLETSRENEGHFENLHQLMLGLLSRHSLGDLIEFVPDILSDAFSIKTSIFVFSEDHGLRGMQEDAVSRALIDGEVYDTLNKIGQASARLDPLIVQENKVLEDICQATGIEMASCARVPLHDNQKNLFGYLLMTSPEKDRFRVTQDTFFIKKLAELLSVKMLEFREV